MLLFHLSLPFYLKNSNFLYWMVPYHMQIYPDKISGCKIDIFDIIEQNVILCVLEMSTLGTTLMIVSIYLFRKAAFLQDTFSEKLTFHTGLFVSSYVSSS